jgi:two-component sensor histidine kinase
MKIIFDPHYRTVRLTPPNVAANYASTWADNSAFRQALALALVRNFGSDGQSSPYHPRSPTRKGLGSRIIEQMIVQQKEKVHFRWRKEGLVCEITLPV